LLARIERGIAPVACRRGVSVQSVASVAGAL
jgi:hypothetical protein